MSKWTLLLLMGSWLWWAMILIFCTSCTTVTFNMATGHAKETISEKKDEEISTKIDNEMEGKGSLFGF